MKSEKGKLIVLDANNKKYTFANPLQETVKFNNTETRFQFDVDKDGFTYILYNNQRYYVEVLEKKQNKFVVLVNGISYSLSVETSFSYKRKQILERQKAEQKTGFIVAPMPGKIIDIFVNEGEKISKNESLLILEAMKMQNEILTEYAGTVKKIYVKKDDTVMKDDILAEIEL